MTIRVDLSSPELRPEAVLQLIQAHTTHRPSENILFKVSQATFALQRRSQNPDYIRVSQQEADEMNAFLGLNWSVDDYGIDERVACKNCGKVLTFYDLFKGGLKRHGKEHIKATLAGGDYHLQVAKEGQTVEFDCTACGTLNVLSCTPNHQGYSTGSYRYV